MQRNSRDPTLTNFERIITDEKCGERKKKKKSPPREQYRRGTVRPALSAWKRQRREGGEGKIPIGGPSPRSYQHLFRKVCGVALRSAGVGKLFKPPPSLPPCPSSLHVERASRGRSSATVNPTLTLPSLRSLRPAALCTEELRVKKCTRGFRLPASDKEVRERVRVFFAASIRGSRKRKAWRNGDVSLERGASPRVRTRTVKHIALLN